MLKKYIALLRGINVGGNNKIAMPALKAAFEAEGFTGVSTYINSGNVLFTAAGGAAALQTQCKGLIAKYFSPDIAVAVLAAEELAEALAHAPAWWNADSGAKHNAIFVLPGATAAEVFAEVGKASPEYEKVACHGRVIFWSAPLQTFSHTRWAKVAGTAVYQKITIRNANTTLKLATLAQQG